MGNDQKDGRRTEMQVMGGSGLRTMHDMQLGFFPRFADAFLKGIGKTLAEAIVEVLLLFGTLLYWVWSKRFHEHFWENVTPWIWVIGFLIIKHSFQAAHILTREVATEISDREITILDPSGRPATKQVERRASRRLKIKAYGTACLVVFLVFLILFLGWRKSPPNTDVSSQPEPLALSMSCASESLPISIPAATTVHVVRIRPSLLLGGDLNSFSGGGIMEDVSSGRGKTRNWPSEGEGRWLSDNERKKLLAKTGGVASSGIYKCDISSLGKATLEEVTLKLNVTLLDANRDYEEHVYTISTDPLSGTAPFTFYIVNPCAARVFAYWPEVASVKVVGQPNRHDVPLGWVRRLDLGNPMVFMPAAWRWNEIDETCPK